MLYKFSWAVLGFHRQASTETLNADSKKANRRALNVYNSNCVKSSRTRSGLWPEDQRFGQGMEVWVSALKYTSNGKSQNFFF